MTTTVQLVIDAQNKADAKFNALIKDLDDLEKKVDNFSSGSKNMTGVTDDAAVSLQTLEYAVAAYSAATIAATAAVTAFVKAYQIGEIAAQNERLIESGREMASQYGGSMDLIVEKVREASLNTVSDMDIIASANKAIMLGLGADAEQLANLMEIAAFRGRAMGLSTTQAFDDIVRGIGRTSPLILDNLGIIVDAEGTYQKYADSIGVAKGELTKAEKVQALLNRVLEEGNSMLEKAGGLVDDQASSYERFNAELENTKNILAKNLLFMSRTADAGRELLLIVQSLSGEKTNTAEFDFFKPINNPLYQTAWAENQKNNLVLLGDLTTKQEEYTEAIAMTEDEIKAMTQANQAYLDTVGSITNELQKYGDKETELQAKQSELIAKKQELIAQGWQPESDKITEINAKLAENEAAMQKNATEAELAGRRRILSMLEQQLTMDGLSAAETTYLLDLGLKWGVYTQQAVDDAKAAQDEVNNLTATFNAMPTEKEIRINVMTNYASDMTAEKLIGQYVPGYASGTGGWLTVPSGHPNDSYPVLMSSGERFAVIPKGASASGYAQGTGWGSVTVNLSYAPVMSLGDDTELKSRLIPYIINGVKEARAQGVIQ